MREPEVFRKDFKTDFVKVSKDDVVNVRMTLAEALGELYKENGENELF